MSIADDLRASMCAGCIRYEQPRTEYCDRCGNDAFVGPVAELEAIVRELGECKRSVLNNECAVVPYWLVARAREVLK